MFCRCTSLTASPVLPARTLLELSCYYWMFLDCTNLKIVKCLAVEYFNDHAVEEMLFRIGEGGVFLKNPDLTLPVYTRLPEGWVIKDYLGSYDLQSLEDPLLCDCFGGGFDLVLPTGAPWTITGDNDSITVIPESSNGETNIASLVIEDNDGDEDREFVLQYTIGEGNTATTGDIRIIQAAPSLTIGDYRYKIKKMLDGRWWMVEILHYAPEGVTIGDGKCGIWYPCSDTDNAPDNSPEGIIAKGLLYSDEFAFNCQIEQTTVQELEGAQGVCPPGWHIPTLSDFMALVGKCNNTEIEPQTDAPYYDAVRNRGSLSMLKEAGFVGKESGYIQGLGVGYEHGYKTLGYFVSMGYVTVSYIFCSTHYRYSSYASKWYALFLNQVLNQANIDFVDTSLSGHPIACGVRCIKNN